MTPRLDSRLTPLSPAIFASRVKWADDEPLARIIIRYRITPQGNVEVDQVLESTDNRLKRRVLKALAESPRWLPARKRSTHYEHRHSEYPAAQKSDNK